MKKLTYILAAFAIGITGTTAGALAQDAAPQTDAAPAEATAPSADTTSTPVTDAEVSSYAQAAAKVQKIAQDASLADDAKQQQMAAAVSEAGLEPQRFNEISKAIGADENLRARIQTALAAHAGGHEG